MLTTPKRLPSSSMGLLFASGLCTKIANNKQNASRILSTLCEIFLTRLTLSPRSAQPPLHHLPAHLTPTALCFSQ